MRWRSVRVIGCDFLIFMNVCDFKSFHGRIVCIFVAIIDVIVNCALSSLFRFAMMAKLESVVTMIFNN